MTSISALSEDLSTVTVTTDGATRGNPGPGGWAALLEYRARERLIDGEEPSGLLTACEARSTPLYAAP
jgi:ribonuclease HI